MPSAGRASIARWRISDCVSLTVHPNDGSVGCQDGERVTNATWRIVISLIVTGLLVVGLFVLSRRPRITESQDHSTPDPRVVVNSLGGRASQRDE